MNNDDKISSALGIRPLSEVEQDTSKENDKLDNPPVEIEESSPPALIDILKLKKRILKT